MMQPAKWNSLWPLLMRRFFHFLLLLKEKTSFVRGWPCSPKFRFSLIRKTELWRTNKPPALRVVGIALALCKKTSLDIIKTGSPTVLLTKGGSPNGQ